MYHEYLRFVCFLHVRDVRVGLVTLHFSVLHYTDAGGRWNWGGEACLLLHQIKTGFVGLPPVLVLRIAVYYCLLYSVVRCIMNTCVSCVSCMYAMYE